MSSIENKQEQQRKIKGSQSLFLALLGCREDTQSLESLQYSRPIQVAIKEENLKEKCVSVDGWVDSKELHERARESYNNIIGLYIAFTTPDG